MSVKMQEIYTLFFNHNMHQNALGCRAQVEYLLAVFEGQGYGPKEVERKEKWDSGDGKERRKSGLGKGRG